MSSQRRFSEWEDCEVDCNQCENYYINRCDGVPKGKKRSCTAFKASRSVVIPEEIKRLKTRLKWLTGALVTSIIVQLLTNIILIFV